MRVHKNSVSFLIIYILLDSNYNMIAVYLIRQKLFRHKHEAESGRTSSVGNDILGFDSSGQV